MVPLISVVIPTVPGRERYLGQAVAAYAAQAPGNYRLDLIVERGHNSVGAAWQAGADKAAGEYLHLTNDDCEPHPGWHTAALEAVERGFLPAPQVFGPLGQPQSLPQWGVTGDDWTPVSMATIPFCSRAQWEKIGPLCLVHYYADDFFGYRGARAGWATVLRSGYAFTHKWAQEHRGAGMSEGDRMRFDLPQYQAARAMAERGEWDKPWP